MKKYQINSTDSQAATTCSEGTGSCMKTCDTCCINKTNNIPRQQLASLKQMYVQ